MFAIKYRLNINSIYEIDAGHFRKKMIGMIVFRKEGDIK